MTFEATSVETTEDALLAGQIRLRQPKNGFRAAIDSVLLPAAVAAAKPWGEIFILGEPLGANARRHINIHTVI